MNSGCILKKEPRVFAVWMWNVREREKLRMMAQVFGISDRKDTGATE